MPVEGPTDKTFAEGLHKFVADALYFALRAFRIALQQSCEIRGNLNRSFGIAQREFLAAGKRFDARILKIPTREQTIAVQAADASLLGRVSRVISAVKVRRVLAQND